MWKLCGAFTTNNLLMLKAGGLVWGLSMGWAYVPPLANVIRWFPEKKGFASSDLLAEAAQILCLAKLPTARA